MKNPKLFRPGYGLDDETTDSSLSSSSESDTAVSLSDVRRLIGQQAKTSAVRQAFAMRSAKQGTIASQNNRPEIVTGLLPLDQIGQRRIASNVSGTMAVLAGGMYGAQTGANVDWSNYTNRMAEFLYVSQVFTPLTVTMSVASRFAGASASNLVNSYFLGGFAGKLTRPGTVGFSFGTDTIDRYTRVTKSIVQIANRISAPWICYVSSSLVNLNKAIIPSGWRVSPRPAPWRTTGVELGNRIVQYGDNTLKRFTYSGEDMQSIAATLSQPRFGAINIQGDKRIGYFFFGLNAYDRNKAGGIGGYDVNTNFNQATQFDVDLEVSSAIAEFRAHGGSRYQAGSASSRNFGYVFAGLDYATHTENTLPTFLNSIFEFNLATRAGTTIGTVLPENPAVLKFQTMSATGSSTDAYLYKGNAYSPNSYIFNFGRRDLAPIATHLVTQPTARWSFISAESDYNAGWGI